MNLKINGWRELTWGGIFKVVVGLVLAIWAIGATCELISSMWYCSRVESALAEGELSVACEYLRAIPIYRKRKPYAAQLIEEYLQVGQVDKAIFVCEYICKPGTGYGYEPIYQVLLRSGRYDEAWCYKERVMSSLNTADNAPSYYAYMVDVINHLSRQGQKAEAYDFVDNKALWFEQYVPLDCPERLRSYTYEIVKVRLRSLVDVN